MILDPSRRGRAHRPMAVSWIAFPGSVHAVGSVGSSRPLSRRPGAPPEPRLVLRVFLPQIRTGLSPAGEPDVPSSRCIAADVSSTSNANSTLLV